MADKKFNVSVVISAIDQVSSKFKDINKSIANSPLSKLNNSIRNLGVNTGLNQVGKAFSNVGKAAGGVVDAVAGIGTKLLGLGAAVGSGLLVFKQFANLADSAKDASAQLGITTKSYMGLIGGAQIAGIEQEEMNSVLAKFSKNIGDAAMGTGEANKVLQAMGVSVKDAHGKVKPLDQLLPVVAEKLSKMQNASIRNAFGAKIFGKNFQELVPFLGKGAAGIAKLTKEAEELGFVLGEDATESGDSFIENWNKIKVATQGAVNVFASAVAPIIVELSQKLIQFFKDNKPQIQAFAKAFAMELPNAIKGAADAFKLLWAVLSPILGVFKSLFETFGTAKVVMVGLTAWLAGPLVSSLITLGSSIGTLLLSLANFGSKIMWVVNSLPKLLSIVMGVGKGLLALTGPVGLIIAGIAALGAGAVVLYKKWEPFRNLVDGIWEKLKNLGSIMKSGVMGFLGIGGVDASNAQMAPALGGAGVVESAKNTRNESRVSVGVDFNNVPRGTRIVTNNPDKAPVDISRGFATVGY